MPNPNPTQSPSSRLRRQTSLLLLALIVSMASGCSWYVKPYQFQQMYTGEPKADSEVTKMEAEGWGVTDRPYFVEIDGKAIDTGLTDFRTYKIVILPGEHDFVVMTPEDSQGYDRYVVTRLKLTTQPGTTYQLSKELPPAIYRINDLSEPELVDTQVTYLQTQTSPKR